MGGITSLAIYDGVVTIAGDEIPVILEVRDDYVRLSAGGAEIGHWPKDECQIAHAGDTAYTITAEDETLRFVPNQPSLFATAVNGVTGDTALATSPEPEASATGDDGTTEAPPAKPLTMGLFYALCLITAGLAIWSLISIIF